MCFMFLPVSIEELVNMAMQLGEYQTFSSMMRATAKQIKAERKAKKELKAAFGGFLLGDGDAQPKGSLGSATPSPSPVAKGSEQRPSWQAGGGDVEAGAGDGFGRAIAGVEG